MKKSEEILTKLYKEGEMLEIPRSLEPNHMRVLLEQKRNRRGVKKRWLYPVAAAVICLCLTGAVLYQIHGTKAPSVKEDTPTEYAADESHFEIQEQTREEKAEEEEDLELPGMTYEEIYAKLSENWETQDKYRYTSGEIMKTEAAASVEDLGDAAVFDQQTFGKTNVQVEQIDEADRIKNDGRYLYQIAFKPSDDSGNEENWGIQILDTKDGLQETAFLDDFQRVDEFYVWNDLLIAVESKYLAAEASPLKAVEDIAYTRGAICENQYHEISIYQIADRANPRKLKTFSLKGSYETSRISDGYFYGISRFTAGPGEGEEDYTAYIPTLDGEVMSADRIYCPEDSEGDSYLVLISIDLEKPSVFADSRAVLAEQGIYYVSKDNIYMTEYQSVYMNPSVSEGKTKDKTQILRFAFRAGKFYARAQGEVPGRLNDSFSLDEYGGYLRAVTTVREVDVWQVTDDRTNEVLGFDYQEEKEFNGLYILDLNLSVKGKIENLAEDEIVYSARFMGDTGYFVTFRQTDPLFAVDLSDPEEPKITGELKVSGFSEYLHFYGEDLLLGIGMEADETTGQQQGMKLSMFDLSGQEPVEKARLNLTDYNYSEALYHHRAVFIDTRENLIGFSAEGSNSGTYWNRFLIFSYEDGAFVKKLEADLKAEDGGYYCTRGTFIGNLIYLLSENGTVRAYDRESWKLSEELKSSP